MPVNHPLITDSFNFHAVCRIVFQRPVMVLVKFHHPITAHYLMLHRQMVKRTLGHCHVRSSRRSTRLLKAILSVVWPCMSIRLALISINSRMSACHVLALNFLLHWCTTEANIPVSSNSFGYQSWEYFLNSANLFAIISLCYLDYNITNEMRAPSFFLFFVK